ncbi:TonB-dependent receptor [Prolixibacteraceae bacterium Z1-6]|uniref:TonB-dependent receptor n=1 Tax=Draconibacterium aestuarii TaxID=2998507 RepID=A0A9X3F6E8_9BACT|nr:TonB-dependent receptor [Prolixibacteraceae bacterium Z1-6]
MKKYKTNQLKRNQSNSKWLLVLISLLFPVFFSNAQDVKIRGQVISENDNKALPGVSVVIKGTSSGTVTNVDGQFNISAPSNGTLVFSFIGMKSQEIDINGKTSINISMKDETTGLDEVVVVGYGTKKKQNLTGAVQQISSEELEKRVVTDPVKALQGAIPNLNITYSSGQAKTVPDLNIRGVESLSGGEPLIIIDGVPSDIYQFMELNPSDVASVSTLMDAASASIYGARAAFGVILVTTKEAESGKLQVSYNMNVSFKNPTIIPEFELNPYTVMQWRQEGTGAWYNLVDDWDLLKQMADEGTESMLNPQNPQYYLYAGRTNWYQEAIKKNALSQTHNLAVSGRNDKVSYYMSGGYSKDNGVFKYGNDQYSKYNMRTKFDFDVTDWFTLSNNSSYSYDDLDNPSQGFNIGGLYNYSTTGVIQNPDGSWTQDGARLFGAATTGGRTQSYNSRFMTSFSGKASFWEDLLTITGKVSFMRGNWTERSYWLPIEYKTGPEVIKTEHPVLDARRKAYDDRRNVYDIYADINKSFSNHNLHLLVGYNQEYYYDEGFSAYRKDLISPSVPSIDLATGDREVSEYITDWATRSGFFRFSYDYNSKYLVEINGRYDGTSRFPKDDRFGFFPSISLGWNIANEGWFENINNYITSFKPRFSYGSLGNQSVGAYAYLPTMGNGKTSSILSGNTHDQQTTIYAPAIVSGSLTWETVQTTNFGIDFGCIKNRLTGSFDYYERATLDMLTKSKQLPGVLGTSEPKENAADLITKGWEFILGWKDNFKLLNDQFNYNVGFTLADSRTWITAFDNPNGKLSDYYVGYEVGTIWGFEVEGLFQSAEEIADHANQSSFWTYPDKVPPGAGDIKFKDLNGDGLIRSAQTINDMQDQRKIGNSRPRYTTGFRANFDWKGFDASMFWQGVLKKDWYPTSQLFWGLNASPWTNLQTYQYENSWTPENTDAYLPRLKGYAASWWSGAEMLRPNTRYLQNAWYLRLKNITLGYSLPSHLTEKININQLRVFVTGENLVTFTGIKNPNIDPESMGSYPMQKLLSCGFSVKF